MEYKKITISNFLSEVNKILEVMEWSKKEGEIFSKSNHYWKY